MTGSTIGRRGARSHCHRWRPASICSGGVGGTRPRVAPQRHLPVRELHLPRRHWPQHVWWPPSSAVAHVRTSAIRVSLVRLPTYLSERSHFLVITGPNMSGSLPVQPPYDCHQSCAFRLHINIVNNLPLLGYKSMTTSDTPTTPTCQKAPPTTSSPAPVCLLVSSSQTLYEGH